MTRPLLDEVLALDKLSLHSPDGSPLDLQAHRLTLAESLDGAEWVCVRRAGELVAYCYAWPREDDWFVGGLSIHPQHRNAAVTLDLIRAFGALVRQHDVKTLRSHVLKANSASMRLHRRLGFIAEMENDRAIGFASEVAWLTATLAHLAERSR